MTGLSYDQKRRVIRDYVYVERERRGIIELVTGHQPEPSCEMFGEARNLIEFQLMQRPEEEWDELKNPEVMQIVYEYVIKEGRSEKRRAVA